MRLAIVGGLIIAAMIAEAIGARFDLSKEQNQYIQTNNMPEKKFLITYCEVKDECHLYGKTLRSCAEAGDANKCVQIKLGGKDYSAVCAIDGKAKWIDANLMPTVFQCFRVKYLM